MEIQCFHLINGGDLSLLIEHEGVDLGFMRRLFTNARMILPPKKGGQGEGVLEGSLLVEDGLLKKIANAEKGSLPEADEVIDCGDDYLAPGLVDLHCHGALGRDAMEATPEAFGVILGHHAARATTTAVLTTVASSLKEMTAVLRTAETHLDAPGLSRLAGIHLEGPWFSPKRRGAHRAAMLRNPTLEEAARLLEQAAVIRRVTLAPELPGALDAVRMLVEAGVKVSAGHSDATCGEARAGFQAGITQATHLYNAMSSLRKGGEEGLAEEALSTPGVLCELIADGIHLPQELLRHAYGKKGWEGIALVSDATAGTGLGEGDEFELGGLPCGIREGAAWTAGDGAAEGRCLAGSTKPLFECIRTMAEQVGIPLAEAVAMATLVPARSLGLEKSLGSLKVGMRADLIRFSPNWELAGVWIGGVPATPGR